MNEKYVLQNRWQLKNQLLEYYGMRVKPNFLKNKIRISKSTKKIILSLPKVLNASEVKKLNRLIVENIIVPESAIERTPISIDKATFCKECVANDYIIPGLEFNIEGLCPMCESKEETKNLRSILPLVDTIPRNNKGRFDVAVFYTGGKDSSYLLYHLAVEKNLRVIAFTWNMPFMTKNALQSIENAKAKLKNVEFISRTIAVDDLKKIYNHLYELENNPCACPSLAYALFYPDMVYEQVPYFVLGNEPVQMIGIYYNRLTPKQGYDIRYHKLLNVLMSIPRVLTLRKPLKLGQMHTIMTMRQLAYGDSWIKTLAGYKSELITNVSDSLRSVDSMVKPLRRAIRISNFSGNIPRLVHVDFDQTVKGGYSWTKIKQLITDQLGWVGPEEEGKALHTSCMIESCKEQSQFVRFYHMKSHNIPFSAIEISLASSRDNYSHEEAMNELKKHLGFSLNEIPSCIMVKEYLNKKN